MVFWKDKEGKELSYKEFMQRWKKGMEGITNLQQTKMQMNSMYIMIIGLTCGFVITLFGFSKLWWLSIILVGGLFNTLVQLLGVWQKKKVLERIELNFSNESIKELSPIPTLADMGNLNKMEVKPNE